MSRNKLRGKVHGPYSKIINKNVREIVLLKTVLRNVPSGYIDDNWKKNKAAITIMTGCYLHVTGEFRVVEVIDFGKLSRKKRFRKIVQIVEEKNFKLFF